MLTDWIVDTNGPDIPNEIRHEGLRTFVNWVGCAVGGASHETVDAALNGLLAFSGRSTSTVLGRAERMDALHAALLNGISSHVLDYDDTHLKTIIHPAGPVASAILALAETRPVSGYDFLTALILGVEAECRIGNCVYPAHYDRGWHITGTAGVFGAAAAAGKILGLTKQQMRWAFGIAGTQSSGFREQFGTMTKSFHPGRAAQNGLASALLAQAGFDSSERVLEAPRGFACVMSDKQDWDEIIEGLGTRWEAGLNSYKPFACGIVIHPTIDGCIQLRSELGDRVNDIESVHLVAHPLVLELTGKQTPQTGLEAKFSVFHSAACALLRGDGSPTAFTDTVVKEPDVVALRDTITAVADPACHSASVTIEVRFKDGPPVIKHVERALGSREVPLTDDQVTEKFRAQSALVIGEEATQKLLDVSWSTPELDDVADVARTSSENAWVSGAAA
ncbi:MmgE/PrpD family protein [Labrenzia aggregata]|uniref:MmgE/PrpD family protein n=1 Tax=Roseibium aggregatum TaxID=187304 RepID=A0A939J5T8_9HYPH|nr:MmgE/PrpD family protein [Roseibium aggregatum]